MRPRASILLAILALAAASLACNLPLQFATPGPVFTPPPAADTAQPAPTETATAIQPTIWPTLAPSATETTLPTAAVTPVPPTATSTGTVTLTPSLIPSRTRLASSPTPPSTLTPGPSTRTPTATSTAGSARVLAVAGRFTTPPTLDGLWDEWSAITTEYPARFVVFGGSNWTGPDDLEASFRAGWDSQYLYLAVKVRDDVYVQNASGANLYQGDSVEVLLDTNLSGDLTSTSLSGDDFQLGISPGRGDVNGPREAYLWFPRARQGSQPGVKIASVRQTGVTRYEVAIPWSVFAVTPAAGQRLGFALSVSDNDNPDKNEQQSMVSNVPDRVLVDPTSWGELRLK